MSICTRCCSTCPPDHLRSLCPACLEVTGVRTGDVCLCPACQKITGTKSSTDSGARRVIVFLTLIVGTAICFAIVMCSADKPVQPIPTSPDVSQTAQDAPYDPQKILEKAKREFAEKDYYTTVNTLTKLNASDLKERQASSLYSRAKAFVVKADAEEAKAKRLTYAETYERLMLKAGMDATVRTEGKNADTLAITYVLVNRPLVYNMVNDSDTTSEWRSLGFKRVRFSDGYESSWSQSLE
jgi:hypothetical protein